MTISYVDSHQHFWQRERGDYDWLTAELGVIYRDFAPQDLSPHLTEAGVQKTILVQAAETDAETDYLLALAEANDFIAGVVGWVDMASPGARQRIETLALNPFFKGIRPMIQGIADPDWILNPELDDAFTTLLEQNLSFDALALPKHLPNLLQLLKRYPNLRTVIDHGAKPAIATADTEQWANDIAAIAEQTQCCCKISGLVTEAGDDVSIDAISPYFEHLYRHFGAERLMWGSDWPVVNLALDYGSWRKLSLKLIDNLTDLEQQQILADTATTFYRVQPASAQ